MASSDTLLYRVSWREEAVYVRPKPIVHHHYTLISFDSKLLFIPKCKIVQRLMHTDIHGMMETVKFSVQSWWTMGVWRKVWNGMHSQR